MLTFQWKPREFEASENTHYCFLKMNLLYSCTVLCKQITNFLLVGVIFKISFYIINKVGFKFSKIRGCLKGNVC